MPKKRKLIVFEVKTQKEYKEIQNQARKHGFFYMQSGKKLPNVGEYIRSKVIHS